MFSARFQRLRADGVEMFAHNGVLVATGPTTHHIDPALAWDMDGEEAYVFWNERNSAQSMWGIYGQRLSDAGDRLWGDTGLVLAPVSTLYKNYPRTVPCTNGAMVFWAEEPTGSFYEDRLIGLRVDASGGLVWPGSPIGVSTLLSAKHRYPVVINAQEMAVLVWEDDRNGTVDLYGQNVNADGTLGQGSGAVAGLPAAGTRAGLRWTTGPAGAARLELAIAQPLRTARVIISDVTGRGVRTLGLGDLPAGERRVDWDGRDGLGRGLPAGLYFSRLDGGARHGLAAGRVLLVE
jgi:hypothetical protein